MVANKTMFNIPEIGSLYYDTIFLCASEPILYTCLDDLNNLYLCVFCEESAKQRKWLVAPVSPDNIIDMLEDKITIRDCFLASDKDKYSFIYKNNKLSFKINDKGDWDANKSPSLPVKGAFMEADEDEFTEEIEYFESLVTKNKVFTQIGTQRIDDTLLDDNNLTPTFDIENISVVYSNSIDNEVSINKSNVIWDSKKPLEIDTVSFNTDKTINTKDIWHSPDKIDISSLSNNYKVANVCAA